MIDQFVMFQWLEGIKQPLMYSVTLMIKKDGELLSNQLLPAYTKF